MKKQLAALAAGLALAFGAQAADIKLVVNADQPGPVIHRNIYGQFAEHLGTGIYEGMWVGPESKIPNVRGWRKDVVNALKELKVPLVRWPGGCFADEYHWRDGIGPRNKRPVKVNTHWGGVPENNAVGTHEFFDLVEQLGAEAYVNANVGTGTPQEAAEWLEYMTGEGNATIVEQRRKNGRDKPFRVHYYALGNEAWGCGGNMRPEYYTDLYRHWATFLKTPGNNRPVFIASGGNDWRRGLVAKCSPNTAHEVLARWSQRPGFTLITQNVDGLHEQSGSRNVIRFHGSIWRLRCWDECGRPEWEDQTVPIDPLPARCPDCGGLARPAVVWFVISVVTWWWETSARTLRVSGSENGAGPR